MFLFLLLTTTVLGVLWICESFRRKHSFADGLPAFKPTKTFLGIDCTLLRMTDEERFVAVNRMFMENEGLFRTWLGPFMHLGVSHPDLAQKVLSHADCLEKPFFYDFVGLEHGLFSAKHHVWKSLRKALNPTFNQQYRSSRPKRPLRSRSTFFPIFVTCCRTMVAEMARCEDGETINLFKYTSKCTLEMICGTSLGSDVLLREGKDTFLNSLEHLIEYVSRRMLSMHLYVDAIYKLTRAYRDEMTVRQKCTVFALKIVHEKKEAMRVGKFAMTSKHATESDPEADDFKRPQIFIDMLLSMSDSNRPFSDVEISENVFTMMVAGNDTSGLTVANACLFLAMYPAVQEKVYAEIMEIFPTEETEINAESLKLLEYTDWFVKEALRHCPVAPTIARQNIRDIEVDGLRIPAGNVFLINFWSLHRRKDVWGPDAGLFDPENFRPERCHGRNPNAYMPFSVGPRNCIGNRYAMISMKMMIVYILKSFKLNTEIQHQDVRYKFGMTLKLSTDYLIQIHRRNKC